MRPQRWRPPSDPGPASCASRAVALALRWGVRPVNGLLPHSPAGVRVARQMLAGFLALVSRPHPAARFTPVDVEVEGGRVRGEWVDAGAGTRDRDRGVVLYLHGSAFAVASARTHRGITSRLAAATGVPVFACDYRLAPSHRFPAAADDVAATHRWLVAGGVDPGAIVVAGDSAGGHLAVGLAADLRDAGTPVPAGLVLLSPLIDLSLGLARARERRHGPDPMISARAAAALLSHHLREADPVSPRLRFDARTVTGLPPVLVHAGGAEMLADDAAHLAELVHTAGGTAHLTVWPDQVHVFHALTSLVPEAELALGVVADFVRSHLGVGVTP